MLVYNDILFCNGRITPPFFQGGDGVYIRNILTYLNKKGTRVTCVGSAQTYPLRKDVSTLKREILRHRLTIVAETDTYISYNINPQFTCTLYYNDYDMLHQGVQHIDRMPNNTLLMTQINYSHEVIRHNAATRRFPLIHFVHDTHELNTLSLNLQPHISLVVYNSAFTQNYFLQQGYDSSQSAIVYPTITTIHHRKPPNKGAILFVNPAKHKGVETVLSIVRKMPQQEFIIQCNYDSSYIDLFSEHRNCTVIKRKHSLHSTYAQTALTLVPSVFDEPFGMIAIEAFSHGIPVIASKKGGLPEAIGSAGIFIQNETDSDSWVQAIQNVYTHPDTYRQLQQAARSQARHFTVKTQVNHLFNELEKHLS